MSPQPEWTLETLAVHLMALCDERTIRYEQRFTAQEKAVAAALISAKEAVNKAEMATEKRFDASNAYRAQLSEQAATFMPRLEAEQRIAQNTEKIDNLAASTSHSFASMGSRLDKMVGRSTGLADGWGYLVGFVGLVGGAISLVLSFH